jgi:hypothetical protein
VSVLILLFEFALAYLSEFLPLPAYASSPLDYFFPESPHLNIPRFLILFGLGVFVIFEMELGFVRGFFSRRVKPFVLGNLRFLGLMWGIDGETIKKARLRLLMLKLRLLGYFRFREFPR